MAYTEVVDIELIKQLSKTAKQNGDRKMLPNTTTQSHLVTNNENELNIQYFDIT